MDKELRKKYYQLCDSGKPLQPDDPENVDIDNLEGRVRGERWKEYLAKKIEFGLDANPPCVLFTGLPGNGKTTQRSSNYLYEHTAEVS